jgi:hypothetical protein
MRIDAEAAAVDGRNGSAPEFEIGGINAVSAQNIHAEARRVLIRKIAEVTLAVIGSGDTDRGRAPDSSREA